MILKISKNELRERKTSDYGKTPKIFEHLDWWIFGEIERMHYTYMSKEEAKDALFKPELYDLHMVHVNEDKRKSSGALEIILRYTDPKKDTYCVLLQDCICYLCNNDGKTIDKLTC